MAVVGNVADAGNVPGPRVKRARLILTAVGSVMVLAPLNSTMIAVALPDIIDDLNISITTAAWLVTSYLIAMASLQPLAGSLGDRYGRRRLMLGGLIGFGGASIGAGFSPVFETLLVFRVLQAVFIALVIPNGLAVVREAVPAGRRGGGFGVVAAVTGLAAASGPPIGGLLVAAAGWQAIFFVNAPAVAIALFLGFRYLPDIPTVKRERAPFDLVGAALLPLLLAGAAAVLVGVAKGSSPALTGPGAAAVAIAGAAFIRWELRRRSPIFEPRLFTIRSFAAASTGIAFSNMAMYSLLIAVPLLLQGRGTYNNVEVGFVLLALSITTLLFSPVGGSLVDRFGRRGPTVAGMVFVSAGALVMAISGDGVALAPLVIGLAVVGIGVGLSLPGLQTTAVESVERARAGSASGLYSTSRYFGSIAGSAILAGLLSGASGDAAGVGGVFILAFVAGVVAVVSALFLVARPSPRGGDARATA